MIDAYILQVRQASPPPKNNNIYVQDADGKTNIRSQPSADSTILGVLKNGTPIKILAQKNNWILVQHLNSIGYISANNTTIKNTYPFIGKKIIVFPEDGQMLSREITLKNNGNIVIMICGEESAGNGCELEYKGKYQNPLYIDKDQNGFLFKDNTIIKIEKSKLTTIAPY